MQVRPLLWVLLFLSIVLCMAIVVPGIVSPGPVQSGYIDSESESNLVAEIPMRRVGRPEDIANAVLFFASDRSDWVTGQVLFVHGGHRMALGR